MSEQLLQVDEDAVLLAKANKAVIEMAQREKTRADKLQAELAAARKVVEAARLADNYMEKFPFDLCDAELNKLNVHLLNIHNALAAYDAATKAG